MHCLGVIALTWLTPPPVASPHAAAIDAVIQASSKARVIFLGEPDHGDGGSMAARAELTEQLYRTADVRWVVFESSAFDAGRADAALDRGEDPIQTMTGAVHDIWSGATELDPLFELMAQSRRTNRPLHVAGIDATPIGPTDRCLACTDVASRLAQLEPDTLRGPSAPVIERLEQWYVSLDRTTRAERPDALLRDLEALAADVTENAVRIDAQMGPSAAEDLALELRGWIVWIRSITVSIPIPAGEIDERDAFMAARLLALLERIPEHERVVVFLHNVHAMRTLPPVVRADGRRLHGMGTPAAAFVCREIGRDAYCLGMTAASGAVGAAWDPQPRPIELAPDSFESRALADSAEASVFVPLDMDADVAPGVMPGGLISFMAVSSDWSAAFDGVWVLRETHPVRRRPQSP